MSHNNVISKSRSQAYLNEFKGYVFEFLVASKLAQEAKIYSQLVSSLGRERLSRLQFYERSIREKDLNLYQSLPLMADNTSLLIKENIPFSNFSQILLTGRDQKEEGNGLAESDLVLLSPNNDDIGLSLKFSKYGSFVNTKSGGIRSFIEKYFSDFSQSCLDQKKLNLNLDDSYSQMGQKLYEDLGEDFTGSFDLWVRAGRSELPGELDESYNDIIRAFYYSQIESIYHCLKKYLAEDHLVFFHSLLPLLGFSSQEIKQVFCFYEKNQDSYSYKDSWFMCIKDLAENNEVKLGELKPATSSFEILHKKFILQIRVKPMNKFTSPALKINCGLKWL